MPTPEEEVADYRHQAAMCMEVATRVSLRSDRERMVAMARRWMELAEKLETRAASRQ
jgi:hypothetical protein